MSPTKMWGVSSLNISKTYHFTDLLLKIVIVGINLTAADNKGQLDAYIKSSEWDLEGRDCATFLYFILFILFQTSLQRTMLSNMIVVQLYIHSFYLPFEYVDVPFTM
jgi:hypothetical protein